MFRRLVASAAVAAAALVTVPGAGSATAKPCELNECWVYTLTCQTAPCPPYGICPPLLPDVRLCL